MSVASGDTFGRWTVARIKDARYCVCLCECGTIRTIRSRDLNRGMTKSCGCARAAFVSKSKTRHGHSGGGRATPTYESWANMVQRCTNQNHHKYPLYGGRGVTICDQWLHSFDSFLADVGERPIGTTLDRFPNPNGNYEPGNVRWATPKEQANNRRPRRRGYTRRSKQ